MNSFCREMDDYCLQILAGTAEADDFLLTFTHWTKRMTLLTRACGIKRIRTS